MSRRATTLLCLAALLACAVVLLPGTPAASADTKPGISHEALYLMKRVGAPAPSPDGKWVVFSLAEPAYDPKDQVQDLWIVPADGSQPPRRLTATKGAESGVAWSPDSRRIAFGAKREGDEVGQIYVLDLAGGEAQRLTTLSTGASRPAWRPDGGAILFASTVYPEAADDEANRKIAAERKARKYNVRVYDGFPVRNWDHWLDDKQARLFVQSLEAGAKAKDLFAGTALAKEPGFDTGESLDATWSPDGASIVFVAATERDKSAYAPVGSALYEIPVAGGEPKWLTRAKGSYSRPSFSPDGRFLYARFEPESGKTWDQPRLARAAWPVVADPVVLTAAFDREIADYAFSPDGATVYLVIPEAGLQRLYAMPAAGGAPRLLIDSKEGMYGNLAVPEKGENVLFVTWDNATHPAEIFRVSPETGGRQAITSFTTKEAEAIDWQPLRHFWHTSKRGKPIHSMIALPPGFDETRKYPLLVLMHGGPHGPWNDTISLRWNYHLLAQPGYVVLATNYTGSTGFGERFAQDILLDPFKGPADEINGAADEAIKRFAYIDGSRQCAAGASYGGHLANWLQATTTRYRCLISHAGLVNAESQWGTSDSIYHREVMAGGPPWEPTKTWREQNPIRYAKSFRTPILVSVGENDFRVPLNNTLENWSVLQRLRVPSRLLVWPDENHWILKPENSKVFYQEVHAWLAKYLGR
jgi:dipeptidyl aminopeptidase/acylaminoacyl peptidase